MIKAFIIPPAFRQVRIGGQVPTKENLEALRLAKAKPKKFDAAMLLNHTEPRMTVESIVKGLGFSIPESNEWEKFLEKTMDVSVNEVTLRKAVMEKCLEDKLDPALRRALLQRSLVHWRSRVRKSMVQIVTVDDLQKAKPATPEGGKTEAGYTVKIVGGKRTYVKEEAKKKHTTESLRKESTQMVKDKMLPEINQVLKKEGHEPISSVDEKAVQKLLMASKSAYPNAAHAMKTAAQVIRNVAKVKTAEEVRSSGGLFPKHWSADFWNAMKVIKKAVGTAEFKAKPKGVPITPAQLELVQGLSAEAKKTFNTILDQPNYRGGLASHEAKLELSKKGLVTAHWNTSDPKKDILLLTDKGKKIAKKLRAMKPEEKRELLFKAMARGGMYYRRVPKGSGKGHNYFYKPDDYNSRADAHVNGEEAGQSYLTSHVLKCVEKSGTKGCDVASFKELVKKFGAKKVAGILKGCAGGKMEFKKGRFYMKSAKSAKPKLVVKGK